jgi:acyl-CoA synthetase (AMP-forming)/AMP-acid ligase II
MGSRQRGSEAGSDSAQRIALRELLRALLRLVPEAPRALRGGLRMAGVKGESIGSIGLLLEERAREHPERAALLFEGQRWSYREFNTWSNRLASRLRAAGVVRGDAVGILFENRPLMLALVAAVAKLGAVAGMLNPNQREEALRHSIAVIRPRLIVTGEECVEALRSAMPRATRGLTLLWDGEGAPPRGMQRLDDGLARYSAACPRATRTLRLADPCFFIFTSGTTGMPKASVMTHLRWLRSGYGMGQLAMRLTPDDVFYCPLPFYHNNALTVSWASTLLVGATLAMGRRFSASRFWDEIRATEATAFIYIGEICRFLLARPATPDDRRHRVRVMAGNGLRPEIWDAFQQRFGVRHICEFYGSSEGNLAFVNALGLPRTAGFCPLPYAVVEFDTDTEQPVRDARGYMRRVKPGGTGLLISEVSDSAPFDGYTDSAATEAKLFRDVFRRGDTWFNSGDLVRDQAFKHIAFVDRVGDTFRWKGENVATTEVERAALELRGVEQAAVYGVEVPHADGRAGMAALQLGSGATFDPAASARELQRRLPAYAVPRFVRLVKAHAQTATFKIRKVELKREGFDPAVVPDPLWVLLDAKRGYQKLDAATVKRIRDGVVRVP